jgi:hypothetical protein
LWLPTQLSQALAHADKSLSELARAAAEATKKCDEIARHKRFLDNQAVESRAFADAAKRKQQAAAAAAAAAAEGGEGGAAAAAAAEVEEEGEVECAVCRSPMSEELQVGPVFFSGFRGFRDTTQWVRLLSMMLQLLLSLLLLLLLSLSGVQLWPLLL